jgi:hypothetical protein
MPVALVAVQLKAQPERRKAQPEEPEIKAPLILLTAAGLVALNRVAAVRAGVEAEVVALALMAWDLLAAPEAVRQVALAVVATTALAAMVEQREAEPVARKFRAAEAEAAEPVVPVVVGPEAIRAAVLAERVRATRQPLREGAGKSATPTPLLLHLQP